MIDESVALESVRQHVWSGFYDTDEIVEIIDEALFKPGEIDTSWLRARIAEEFCRKREAETTWPAVTDCDRLDQAFDALSGLGIIALQNAGYTLSDGTSDVSQRYFEAGAERSGIIGYCFFHGQDVEHVIDDGTMCLAFGDIHGDDKKGIEIGQVIVKVLAEHGFEVEWSELIDVRIRLMGIKWQRRQGRG